MNNLGVIDQFTNVFSRYINSGFGLLSPEVHYLTATLVTIDLTLAGLFWAMGGTDDIIARLIKKTLYIGAFVFIISNFSSLSNILLRSFAGLGLLASGSTLTAGNLLRPGALAAVGVGAAHPILAQMGNLVGFPGLFTNFDMIAVLGLAFKAGTDDTRQSPGLALASQLSRKGAEVRAHDPLAVVAAQGFEQVGDPYEAAEGADALVVATGWPSYRDLRPDRLGRLMCQAVVLDAAGVLDEGAFAGAGLDFYGVGRGQPTSFHPVIWRPFEWSLASGAALAAAGSPR